MRGKTILIAAGVNSKSPLWDSPISDNNGEIVEPFIAKHNLHVLNNSTISTFSSARGESHIDVTLVTDNLLAYITSWNVLLRLTTSYHIIIKPRIKIRNVAKISPSEKPQPTRFLLTRVNRVRFDGCLKESMDTILSTIELPDKEGTE